MTVKITQGSAGKRYLAQSGGNRIRELLIREISPSGERVLAAEIRDHICSGDDWYAVADFEFLEELNER